jgi:hypothetical protein
MGILDCWGQTNNPALHDKKFLDKKMNVPFIENNMVEIYTTSQPCNVYFYTQVNNYIAKFQNCPVFIAVNPDVIV